MRFKNGFECYDNRVGSRMMGRVAWSVAARRKRGKVAAVRSDPAASTRRESERMLGGGDG